MALSISTTNTIDYAGKKIPQKFIVSAIDILQRQIPKPFYEKISPENKRKIIAKIAEAINSNSLMQSWPEQIKTQKNADNSKIIKAAIEEAKKLAGLTSQRDKIISKNTTQAIQNISGVRNSNYFLQIFQGLKHNHELIDEISYGIPAKTKLPESKSIQNIVKDYLVTGTDNWAYFKPKGYGESHFPWKAHIYCDSPSDWASVMEKVAMPLKEKGVYHKTHGGLQHFHIINSDPAQKGKSFAIYARNADELADIIVFLDDLLVNSNLSKRNSNIIGDNPFGKSGRLFYRFDKDTSGRYRPNDIEAQYKPENVLDVIQQSMLKLSMREK